jgi:tetratricopeptide (TPR) repeat protein
MMFSLCTALNFTACLRFCLRCSVILVVGLFLSAPPGASAQTPANANDARIQELYAQAKSRESVGDTAGAIEAYRAILMVAPRLGSAYNNLGVLYFKLGDYTSAAEVLRQALKVDPKMKTASALLGISLSEMGKYAEARGALEAALRANPRDSNAEKTLATDLIKLGDFDGAAAHLRQISKRDPHDQETWYLLGEVYMKLSQNALAQMNSIDPDSELVHEMSGEIMESMKNYDGALFEYKKAADMAPKRRGIHYKLGSVYWTISQWDAAAEQLQAELANDPKNCMAHALIGDILIDQRTKFEEGIAEESQALALCPELTQAQVDRGRAYLKLNRHKEAVNDLQAAERATPDDASTHFFLAQAYRSLGEARRAQAEMEIFTKLEESTRAATAARARQLIESKEAPHQ